MKKRMGRRFFIFTFFQQEFFKSKLFHIILFLVIFGMGILSRFLFLSADLPPVSWSQDLTTDGPQYTLFARSEILTGDLDPYGHYRFSLWIYSAYTFLGYIFFKLFGLGRFQTNMIPATLSVLTLLFFYLAAKKSLGFTKAMLATFFLSINFVLIAYSRNSFTEISSIFFIVLCLFFLTFGLERKWLLPMAGASQALAIFFCKVLSAFTLGSSFLVLVFAGFFSVTEGNTKDLHPRKSTKYLPFVLFFSGFMIVFLIWYFAIYYPATRNITEYVREMSVGLYGSPEGLHSLKNFIYWFFTFGGVNSVFISSPKIVGTDLFYKMPVIFVFAVIYILSFWGKLFSYSPDNPGTKLLTQLKKISPLEMFLITWLLFGFLFMTPWNYRPLRYQTLLLVPLCGLASFSLIDLVKNTKAKTRKVKIWFWVLFIAITMLLVFHLISFFIKFSRTQISLDLLLLISLLGGIVMGLAFYFWTKKEKAPLSSGGKDMKILFVVIAIIFSFLLQFGKFFNFSSHPKYSLKEASTELGEILSEDAVLSGPYGPPLTLDNKINTIIHMFGVAYVDTALFLRYPITHLALDQGGNAYRAFKDYPEVMKNAKLVTSYILRNTPVDIYRIAECTGNPAAKNYRLSVFERAIKLREENKLDSAAVVLNKFIQQHPRSFSAYQGLADIYLSKMESDTLMVNQLEYLNQAIHYLNKTSEVDPSNFLLHQKLGVLYMNLYRVERNRFYWNKMIDEWEKSLKLYPENKPLRTELQRMKGF
ncbi:MAG: glycosyltransferase family 39 protein [candidate division Zixibacteria bacterium]|nr:glycosyltransferase family 39 protein [candidate division Zixibacteria bacterium]